MVQPQPEWQPDRQQSATQIGARLENREPDPASLLVSRTGARDAFHHCSRCVESGECCLDDDRGVTARLMLDFKTITDLRKDNGDAIRKHCREFVVLCRRLELLSAASLAIDGSKFKAVKTSRIASAFLAACLALLLTSIASRFAWKTPLDHSEIANEEQNDWHTVPLSPSAVRLILEAIELSKDPESRAND
jgi:hypothetical protein